MGVPLVALRQMVIDRLGVPAHDEFFTPTILDTNINLALTAIESEHRWPWNERAVETTINGTAELAVPDDWRATRAIINKTTEFIEWTYYDLVIRFGTEVALPTHFSLLGRTLYFRPIPPGEIEVVHLYYAEPKLLAADIDEPNLPTQHIGTLVAKAAQLCSVREDDRPSADSHLAEYLQGMDRMRKEVRGTTRPTQIRVRPGSWL